MVREPPLEAPLLLHGQMVKTADLPTVTLAAPATEGVGKLVLGSLIVDCELRAAGDWDKGHHIRTRDHSIRGTRVVDVAEGVSSGFCVQWRRARDHKVEGRAHL